MSQQQQPKYLTGDSAATQEFLDKFDVSSNHPHLVESFSPVENLMICS